nr:hypothetical protein [Tanacetum cinerariifolium]
MFSDTKLTKDKEGESVNNIKYKGMIDFALLSMFGKCRITQNPIFVFVVVIVVMYSQVKLQYDDDGYLYVPHVIQNRLICLSLEPFLKILGIPYKGQCVFTTEWSLDALSAYQESSGPYHIDLPTPNEVKTYLQIERTDLTRALKGHLVELTPNNLLTKEVSRNVKKVEIIHSGECFQFWWKPGSSSGLSRSYAILYCYRKTYNLAYFIAKRIELSEVNPNLTLPYGMFLTCLFNHVMGMHPHLVGDQYVIVDKVMLPLIVEQPRKVRKDAAIKRSRHSTSSSFAFHHGSSSHQNDEDNDELIDEVTSRNSTHYPRSYYNSLSPI